MYVYIIIIMNINNKAKKQITELNFVDKQIVESIKSIVGGNPAYTLNIEYTQNPKGNKQIQFFLNGDKNSETYIDDPINMVINEIHTVSGGNFEHNVSDSDSLKCLHFRLTEGGVIHAKGYYTGKSN